MLGAIVGESLIFSHPDRILTSVLVGRRTNFISYLKAALKVGLSLLFLLGFVSLILSCTFHPPLHHPIVRLELGDISVDS